MRNVPLFTGRGADTPRKTVRTVVRDAIVAILRDRNSNKYLCLRWKKVPWETFVTGVIERGQTAEEAARAELLQETGYKHVRLIMVLPGFDAYFYHHLKKVNSLSIVYPFLFELI